MLRNYIKIAWRNLVKSKVFSLINIAGLAIGLSSFILIALYVIDETSYDRYNEKADRIYRINTDVRFGGTDLKLTVSSDPLGATMMKDYPEVEQFARIYNSNGNKLIKKGKEFISEDKVAHVDSTFFDIFTLPALEGDTHTALNEPNTVVITESMAKKYFGTTHAVGNQLETNENGGTLYKVTAVIKDVPVHSHFHFGFFFSMDNVDYGWGNFLSNNHQTYLLLRPGTDPRVFERNFRQVLTKYVLPQARRFMQIESMDEFEKSGNKLDYSLMRVTDIHLHSNRFPEFEVNSNIQYVYIFSAAAIFILLIACINFMNLSTARSANRAKEVGIRKVLGTEKRTLVSQFLTESTLMVVIALLLALLIASIAMPYFNELSGKDLAVSEFFRSRYIIVLILLPFAVGTLAGLYPAFFLSSFKPITVLKGKIDRGFKRSRLRSSLVVFQFFASIFLIIGTIVVYRQLHFVQTKKLGFSREQVVIVNNTGSLGDRADAFREEVSKMSGVSMSSFAGFLPVKPSARNDNTFSKEAVMDMDNGFNMQIWNVDYDYIPTLNMEMVKGRNFSREFGGDSTGIIINESTANLLGFDDPIGKKLYSTDGSRTLEYNIVGVVKNFHFESLREQISPVSFRLGYNKWATAFKVSSANITELMSSIETKWKQMAPGMPFSYQFMDDTFDSMYRAEQRVGKIAMSFAVLAVVIACLGLFGLATYMAEQRTKEIGVRKVLGASVPDIVKMLSKDFTRLVAIGALIAFPLAWFAMRSWLQDFAYRVSIGWWIFLAAAGIALLVALVTVASQAIRAALSNPVNSLRSE